MLQKTRGRILSTVSRLTTRKTSKALIQKRHPPQVIRPYPKSFRRCKLTDVKQSILPYKINIKRLKPGLGDMLMLTPALRGLREKFPYAEITLSVRSTYTHDATPGSKRGILYDCVRYLPYIDHLVDVDGELGNGPASQGYDFDIGISNEAGECQLEKPGVKSMERIDIFASYLGSQPSEKTPFIHVPKVWQDKAREIINNRVSIGNKKVIVIGENSNTNHRDLPQKTIFELADLVRHNPELLPVVFTEKEGPRWNLPGVVELRGELNNYTFLGLVACADLVVCVDTGTLHTAGALNKKIVSIFGSTHPGSRTSYYKNCSVIWHKDSCPKAPCWYSVSSCKNEMVCFTSVRANEIYNSILTRLRTPLVEIDPRPTSLSIYLVGPGDGTELRKNISNFEENLDIARVEEIDIEDFSLPMALEIVKKNKYSSDLVLFVSKKMVVHGKMNWIGRMISKIQLDNLNSTGIEEKMEDSLDCLMVRTDPKIRQRYEKIESIRLVRGK